MITYQRPTLLVVSHGNQENYLDAWESPAKALADRLGPRWQGLATFGYMRVKPGLEEQCKSIEAQGEGRLVVFPLFFANGHLVQTELPNRLKAMKATNVHILPPAVCLSGCDKMLATHIGKFAHDKGWYPECFSVVLVFHGLKTDKTPAPEATVLAQRLAENPVCDDVVIAQIEGKPSLRDWKSMVARQKVIFIPMLAGGGTHERVDIPEMIGCSNDIETKIFPPVGRWSALEDLVLMHASLKIAETRNVSVSVR